MIPILSRADIVKISDPVLRAGVEKEFERLPDDFQYPSYGYFIVIEDERDLELPISLAYGTSEFVPMPFDEYVEMVEEFEGYRQIVLVLEGDFGISLFVKV